VNCSGTHASGDRRCPVFLDENAFKDFWVKGGLSFLDVPIEFLENKP
jgi:hypothetical protein